MDCNELIGIPFAFGGRTTDGLDCWGLVVEVYRRLGIPIEDVEGYSGVTPAEEAHAIVETCGHAWRPVAAPYELWDVLVFDADTCGVGTHCALWLGHDRILHAVDGMGVIQSPIRAMRGRLTGAYRREAVPCLA